MARWGLSGIVAVYLTLSLLYAVNVPKWNAPDEPAHFNYVKAIAETGQFPILVAGDYDQALLEKLTATRFPPGESVDSIRYESHQPPLYYVLAAPVYLLARPFSLDGQVLGLRLFSTLLGALTLLIGYATVRRTFSHDRLVALATAGFIATVPMYVFINASINNDALAILVLSSIVLASVSFVRQPDNRNVPLLGLLLGAAFLTKVHVYAGLGVVALAVAIVHMRSRGVATSAGRILRDLGIAYGLAIAIGGWWFVRNAWVYGGLDVLGSVRHDQVVTGQPLTGAFNPAALKHLVTTVFQSFWAQFGWMGTIIDSRLYVLLAALTALASLGLVLYLLQVARRVEAVSSSQLWSLALLALCLLMVTGVLVAYNFTYVQAQGRYLFPAIVPISAFFVLGLREVMAPKHRPVLFGLLFVAMAYFDMLSLFAFIVPDLRR